MRRWPEFDPGSPNVRSPRLPLASGALDEGCWTRRSYTAALELLAQITVTYYRFSFLETPHIFLTANWTRSFIELKLHKQRKTIKASPGSLEVAFYDNFRRRCIYIFPPAPFFWQKISTCFHKNQFVSVIVIFIALKYGQPWSVNRV